MNPSERTDHAGFRLSDELDPRDFSRQFRERRRVRIPNVLKSPDALRLYKHLAHEIEWNTFLVSGETMYGSLSHGDRARDLSAVERELQAEAASAGSHGFASLYDANRLFPEDIPEGQWADNPHPTALLARFSEFLNSQPFLDLAKAITGIPGIVRADVQATRHRPGHFSSYHTGLAYSVARGRRLAAFEVNLTVEWRPEWGGLCGFKLGEDATMEACIPSFNLLDVYGPRKGRWVSEVSTLAAGERLAIFGWFYGPEAESSHAH